MFFDKTGKRVVLAPMAGITDLPFRIICREYGADLAYTEMVSAKALCYGDKKTVSLLKRSGERAPYAVQLFGSDPDIMAKAAKLVSEDFDIIDINMGCPAPKIVKNGEGSALMKNLPLAGRIVEAVAKTSKIPVTVKMRRGFDTENCAQLAKIAEECGAAAVTVHGRFTTQMYSGESSLEAIKRVVDAVKIPVIGNGDIFSREDAERMFSFTGCSGISVARGALGNPFIFREIKGGGKPTAAEKINTAIRHTRMLAEEKGEKIGILNARKHTAWYVKGMRGASEIKKKLYRADTLCDIECILQEIDFNGDNEAF